MGREQGEQKGPRGTRTIFELDKLIDLINGTTHTILGHHACCYFLSLKGTVNNTVNDTGII